MNSIADQDPTVQPLKAIIHGPPASGKTTLARRLCQLYGAHYVTVETMVEEILQDLVKTFSTTTTKHTRSPLKKERIAHKKPKDKLKDNTIEEELLLEEEEIEEEEDEGKGLIEEWEDQVREITMLMAKSETGTLPDEYVSRLMKAFLVNDVCQRRGYVLDGYPTNIQQAREIFGQAAEDLKPSREREGEVIVPGESGEERGFGPDQVGDIIGNASNKIMPAFVFSLQATDELLCERVMKLPHTVIQSCGYDEANMLRRLAEFRACNTEGNTMLTLFDDNGIHPILLSEIDEETNEPLDFECIWKNVTEILGEPIPGFGLTPEEMNELIRLEQEQKRLELEEFRLERKLREDNARLSYQDKMEKWTNILEKLQMEEEKILAAQSEPLRFYLMKYIFPTLTKGLIEVAKVKPEDPVDYLAEFLFRENPEGKMFDPSYTRDGEQLLEQFETEVEPTLLRSCSSIKNK
ncbi:hypothetical protein NQ315_009362 [Exocentrus adspersus]|uniref:Adenylate kinase 7 n=1 Tax=Exocentrus adspersus TaxID=1586481 RepID=A0AAV8WG20_9CUCU|nr:hypothetical protein NQ315_009362 [Exocentrus adspersus]